MKSDSVCIEKWTAQSLINYCTKLNIDPKTVVITACNNQYFEPRPWLIPKSKVQCKRS